MAWVFSLTCSYTQWYTGTFLRRNLYHAKYIITGNKFYETFKVALSMLMGGAKLYVRVNFHCQLKLFAVDYWMESV